MRLPSAISFAPTAIRFGRLLARNGTFDGSGRTSSSINTRRPCPMGDVFVAGGGGGEQPGEELRLCARCLEWKPISKFHRSRTGQLSYCRECRNAYDREYYRRRGRSARLQRKRVWLYAARAWMATLKEGIACADCGRSFPSYVMHWDHLPGLGKVESISTMVGTRSREAVIEELKKCELICANCHILRTVRRSIGVPRKKRPVGVGGLEPPTTSAQG